MSDYKALFGQALYEEMSRIFGESGGGRMIPQDVVDLLQSIAIIILAINISFKEK